MITWHEVRKELLQDPDVRREYDTLKQEELAAQMPSERVEKANSKHTGLPPVPPHTTYA